MKTGAFYSKGICRFVVWAPETERMMVHIVALQERNIEMKKNAEGYFFAEADNIHPGARYFFRPGNQNDFPDPASFSQPGGVHEASEVIDHQAYLWNDAHWKGLPFKNLILYEIHVGTFTPQGTFEAIIPRLKDLKKLGINALEIMPVAQFPGERNWGYDGVYTYAVQNSYGGVTGFKELIDACHQQGMAVFLDVVYNHLGPEGNYFAQFGPYFTHKYETPWGDAINYDGAWSDGVRDFFVNNILYWFETFHIDGLRLDAVHTIFDDSAFSFWELIQQRKKEWEQKTGRIFHLIAESDLNSPRTTRSTTSGGQGFDAQWLDDFHHALYVVLYPEGKERYEDFGTIQQLAKSYKEGFVHSGEYVHFRKRKHGASSAGIPGENFIAFIQNHDQIGNRPLGERLSALVNFEKQKLAAAALLLSPYIPMLFMGEEYADPSPFFYFVSHSDKELIKAVREGRKKEFAAYKDKSEMPDAEDDKTFFRSKLQWEKRNEGAHKDLRLWYKKLITLRQTHPALQNFNKSDIQAYPIGSGGLMLLRCAEDGRHRVVVFFNFSEHEITYALPEDNNTWKLLISSRHSEGMLQEQTYGLPTHAQPEDFIKLPPLSICVYEG